MALAYFFDLDGTLLDTAPDMVAALNALRAEHNLSPLDYAMARTQVSNGAAGLLSIAFAHLDADGREALRGRYLDLYAERLSRETAPFPGMLDVLDALDNAGQPWGIVTNKPAFLTEPLLAAQGLSQRCACIVSGDTLAQRKPHPEPLLHAARVVGVASATAVYVGDARRDIQAGQAAGMVTVVATYGYMEPGEDPLLWGADHAVDHPTELLHLPGFDSNPDTIE
jgi:phosphoglycolate phosphatase